MAKLSLAALGFLHEHEEEDVEHEDAEHERIPLINEEDEIKRVQDAYANERNWVPEFIQRSYYSLNNSVGRFKYEQADDDNFQYQSVPAYVEHLTNNVIRDIDDLSTRYRETNENEPEEYSLFPSIKVAYVDEAGTEFVIHHPLDSKIVDLPTNVADRVDAIAIYMITIGNQLEEREVDWNLFKSSGTLFSHIVGFDMSVAILTNGARDNFASILGLRAGFTCVLPDRLLECKEYIYNPESSISLGNCAFKAIKKALKLNNEEKKIEIAERLCTPNMAIRGFKILEQELRVPINIYSTNSKPKRRKIKGEYKEEKANRVSLMLPSTLNVSSTYVINLLLLDGTSDSVRGTVLDLNIGHYCLIKNLKKVHGTTKAFCDKCCTIFASKTIKDETHRMSKCWLNKVKKFKPKLILAKTDKEAKVSYAKLIPKTERFGQTLKHCVVYYADFEAYTSKSNEMKNKSVKILQKHLPCGVCWIRVSCIPLEIKTEIMYYRDKGMKGASTVQYFWDTIRADVKKVKGYIDNHNEEISEAKELQKFERTCEAKKFPPKIMNLIRGYYRYYYIVKDFPVFFHNLKGYDSHPLLKDIGDYKGRDHLSVLAQTNEKYISFTLGRLKFIDSKGFLNFSLEKMVSDMSKKALERKDYVELRRLFPRTIFAVNVFMRKLTRDKTYEITDEQLVLIIQKGIYPYDYMDGPDKFRDIRLPGIKDFYSILTKRHISEEDYTRAIAVWILFNIKTMGEYHDLYNVQDVGLLADCFEQFRYNMMNWHGLDPADEYTSPGVSWKATLKSGATFHSFKQDQLDMQETTEDGTRGGISIVPGRELQANNKYMGPLYDKSKPSSYLLYVDVTAMYACAMTQLLPNGNYEWLEGRGGRQAALDLIMTREYGDFDGKYRDKCDGKITADEKGKPLTASGSFNYSTGHTFMIDGEVPPVLHDYFWDYPICPRKESVTFSKLSPYSQKRLRELDQKNSEAKKLLVSLDKLEKYVVHERSLQLYIKLGLVVTKIHKVMRFTQGPEMRNYILKNANERANHDNEFVRELLKLLNNAVFGKSMENKRKRIVHKIAYSQAEFQMHLRNPAMKSWTIFSENTIGVNFHTEEVKLDKPVIVGFSILEISKCLIYNFYYNILKKRYPKPGQITLGFSDTDSLMVRIETEDLWQDISDTDYLLNALSTYTLPKSNPAYRDGVKTPGKLEVQNGLCNIIHFKGLQAKFYAYKMIPCLNLSETEQKKVPKNLVKMCGKGISHNYLAQEAKFDNYLADTPILVDQVRIGHSMHELSTTAYKKKAFNPIDNKFYQIDGKRTIPYGHWRIAEYENALLNGESDEQALRFLDRNYGTYESIVLPQLEELSKKGTKVPLTSFDNTLESVTKKRKLSSKSSVNKSKKVKC